MKPFYAEDDSKAWDEYVKASPRATLYHRWAWRNVVERVFRHPVFYIEARDGDDVRGVLPLVFFKKGAFGRALVSLPFVNYGGLLAESKEAEAILLSEAASLGRRCGADYVELRHAEKPEGDWPCRISKVTMLLDVSGGEKRVWENLSTKQRTRVRRAQKAGFTIVEGGRELLDPYYRAFSENMRDLASPVHDVVLFRQILEILPGNSRILVVMKDQEVVGGAFALTFRDRVEIAWSSCRRLYFKLRPNEFLFWELLRWACGRGFRVFDFGRSSPGSGTFQFKAQWGAAPVELHWQYWFRSPECAGRLDGINSRHSLARRVWTHLPVAVTRVLGPRIRRNIPL